MTRVLVWGHHGLLAESLHRIFQSHGDIHFWGRAEIPATRRDASRKISQLNPGAIINASGYTRLGRAEETPCLVRELHVELPSFLAAYCRDRAIPFVTVSTDYVFSGKGQSSWNEFDRPDPVNAYGKSKLAGEYAVQSAYPQAKIIRTAGLFGSSPAGSKVSFPERIVRQARLGQVPMVRSDLTTSLCHVDDLTKDLWTILWGSSAGIFHIAHSGGATWLQVAELALAETGLSTRVRATETPDFPRPASSVLISNRRETQTGQAARKSWQEALRVFMREIRNHE